MESQISLNLNYQLMLNYYQMNKASFEELRCQGKVGAILICGLPKSANDYIWRSLAQGLGIEYFQVSRGGIPNDIIYYFYLRSVRYKDVVMPCHAEASISNLFFINRYLDRLIVNVRDVRQATLSWCHYMHLLKSHKEAGLISQVPFLYIPEHKYFSMSLKEQIDFNLEKFYLPFCIKWIESWLDAEDNPSFYPKILFTQQELLKQDTKKFFESILDFYELDKLKFKFPDLPEFNEGTHNRKGSIDEWREVFTKEQAERASNMIPKRLLDRFGWSEK